MKSDMSTKRFEASGGVTTTMDYEDKEQYLTVSNPSVVTKSHNSRSKSVYKRKRRQGERNL